MQVFFFGDNSTQGFFDNKGGWANRLAQEYQDNWRQNLDAQWIVGFNLGVYGSTAEKLLDRLEPELAARAYKNETIVVVLSVGINDAGLTENRVSFDENVFQETYGKLIDIASKWTNNIVCVGLNAVDEQLTNPWPYGHSRSWNYKNNRIHLFENCIKQLAIMRKLTFIPLHDLFLQRLASGEKLLTDGLHPNEAGHQLICEQLRPAIGKYLI